jgi:hypothetical protein
MVDKILELTLVVISLYVSTIEAIISGWPDLATAWALGYDFLKGAGSWIGYVVAAVYYFGLELGYGDILCTAMGYGYYAIYYLNYAISFGQ